jgi:3-deoxy-D-manno-octulosonate 8-phosphate phosphatase (KDO 8-P phosphatase)
MPTPTSSKTRIPPALRKRLAAVKLFLCDVDGVLTDASVWMGMGVELKRFNILDGFGLVMLRENGVRVGWISSRPSEATTARARDLKIHFLLQQKGSKVELIESILKETGCGWNEVCYAGDDIVDLGPLKRAGVAIAVANAIPEARALAHYTTRNRGGEGAVREIVELILKAQGHWDRIVKEHAAV